jgi:hypothetical protein
VRPDRPDLDRVIDAFLQLIEAATYADSVRRSDDIEIHSRRELPAGSAELRQSATAAEHSARSALYEALDHSRAMRLIPRIDAARFEAAARAEADYEALRATGSGEETGL